MKNVTEKENNSGWSREHYETLENFNKQTNEIKAVRDIDLSQWQPQKTAGLLTYQMAALSPCALQEPPQWNLLLELAHLPVILAWQKKDKLKIQLHINNLVSVLWFPGYSTFISLIASIWTRTGKIANFFFS